MSAFDVLFLPFLDLFDVPMLYYVQMYWNWTFKTISKLKHEHGGEPRCDVVAPGVSSLFLPLLQFLYAGVTLLHLV